MSQTQPDIDNSINYIEFTVADISRSKAFYGTVFGWSFTDYGPEYCAFSDGHMNGGFALGVATAGGPLVVLYSTDLTAVEARIKAASGKIVKAAFSFPGGRRFHFTDPDGYELAVWSEN
jgi:predicted enzyme related to lactoylglutathione lyase